MGKGKYVEVDMQSVKTSASKSIEYLTKKLPQIPARSHLVIFLGETHRNEVDQAVTQAMLTSPPVQSPEATRVIFERQLDSVYFLGATITDSRTERTNLQLNRTARSKLIAEMIEDAWKNHSIQVIYVPCGSAHAVEIFDHLDKRVAAPFTFISKLSSTD